MHDGIIGSDGGIHDYRMWIDSIWPSPMDRLIKEGIEIGSLEAEAHTGSVNRLNSKSDFSQTRKVQLNFHQGLHGS